ncbi:MAG: amidohydrolase family protein, partial [Rhodospirillaceae bacterium]|nr:amidohydrolase family protein [Rhodospirillaceae bacterium]
ILDHDIGAVQQLPENLFPLRGLEIQAQAFLVSIGGEEIGADVVNKRRPPSSAVIAIRRRFHLHHAGAHVAHNPVSNMRLGSGIADTILMRRHGVNVGIGTDACNCGDHLNMFENMRLACHSSRVKDHTNMEWLTAPEVIEMATECSARAMGFGDRIGRIAPGYQADIVFLDLADVSFIPFTDPCNQIVHCEDGAAVERVIVGGRTIVQGGKVTTVDMPALRREVETIMERLDSVQAERKELIEKLELPVSTYCNGLLPEHAQHAAANP